LQLWNCRNANPAQTRLGDKYRQKIPPFCLEIIFGYFVNWHKSFWYLLGQQHPTPNSNIPKVFPKFSSIINNRQAMFGTTKKKKESKTYLNSQTTTIPKNFPYLSIRSTEN
jgi:hypothetical protein